jgi:membrane-associated phospholipid phosphatase
MTVLVADLALAQNACLWGVTYVVLAVALPMLQLAWLLRRGEVTGLDVPLREQRIRPFAFATACAMLGWLILWVNSAPVLMIALAGAVWLQTLIILAVTLRWKISVHCTTAAGMATMTWCLLGMRWPMVLCVPLIAWSRIRLRRHTPSETVGGAILGLAVFLAMLWLVNGTGIV